MNQRIQAERKAPQEFFERSGPLGCENFQGVTDLLRIKRRRRLLFDPARLRIHRAQDAVS
jgi:hypothetical protein